ncbi:hypothetical protein Tco_0304684 [Tanacetum coccineum]
MPTEPSKHADSPSLDAELALTDSEIESEEEVPVIKARDQDKGQAGPNPGLWSHPRNSDLWRLILHIPRHTTPQALAHSGWLQQQGNKAPSLSKIAASASQSMAWMTSDTQYESADIHGAQELSLTDYLMQDDSIPEEQFQIEECHKMLTNQVDWTNPEGAQVRVNVNRPLPLGGPPGHVTIQTQFFFNKDLEYLRYGSYWENKSRTINFQL